MYWHVAQIVRLQHSRRRSRQMGFSDSASYGTLLLERRVAHVQQASAPDIMYTTLRSETNRKIARLQEKKLTEENNHFQECNSTRTQQVQDVMTTSISRALASIPIRESTILAHKTELKFRPPQILSSIYSRSFARQLPT